MYHVNVNKLNGAIAERNMTKDGLALGIGIDRCTLYRRIKNNNLRVADMHMICKVLNLSREEAISIFLAE